MKPHFQTSAELLLILLCSFFPLFFDLSYQINLYMLWEGAYRLSLGELPYRDFGIPMGVYGWVVPALFFKVFGASLFTLAKAQAFMNLVSGLSFRWILVNVGSSFQTRILSLVIFSLTYILGLYWPQYNHTVIIFQLIAWGFLFTYFAYPTRKWGWINVVACSFFLSVAFFTKQDAGALAILITIGLISYHSFSIRSVKPALILGGSLVIFFLVNILPFIQYDFGYWFNYGQPPHYARISIYDIVRINMEESRWEKFYFLCVLLVYAFRKKQIGTSRIEDLFFILTLGVLAQAMVFQVTSYVPRDNNIFFHAFASAYLLYYLNKIPMAQSWQMGTVLMVVVSLWWSEKYWKYADRLVSKLLKPKTEGVVSINTYILEPEECNLYANLSDWRTTNLPAFNHVRMPAATIEGIGKVINLIDSIRKEKEPVVLNMSELTPLAKEADFKLQQGPLWFHLGVGLFNRELSHLKQQIIDNRFDIVLFEHIPTLNNFYPFPLQKILQENYILVTAFEAPRIVYPGTIEVYHRKK